MDENANLKKENYVIKRQIALAVVKTNYNHWFMTMLNTELNVQMEKLQKWLKQLGWTLFKHGGL